MNGMAGGRDRGGDALLRAFARDLAKMRRDLRNLEAANQISSASIEGGTLDVYDDADVLRERIGKQANGSYGRLVLDGPVPPIPSEPDVVVIADGVVAITWDGRSEEKWPFVEFEAVRVHLVSDEFEACDRDNQVGAIFAARGGTIVAVTESDDDNPVYARLVAVSSAGHVSDPSPAVLVDELDEDDLEEEQEELEFRQDGPWLVTAAGAQDFTLSVEPEQDSEHLYINGIEYDESEGWSRTGTVITVADGLLRVDDVVKVEYARMEGADVSVIVPFGASGWKYKQITKADGSDYSATGYDDSGWSTGTAPFGNGYLGSVNWTGGTRLWMRRAFAAADDVTITFKVEDHGQIYVNGNLVADLPTVGAGGGYVDTAPGPFEVSVPAGYLSAGQNVVAFRCDDDPTAPYPDNACFADVQIEGRLR